MKRVLILLVLMGLAGTSFAQTPTVPVTNPPGAFFVGGTYNAYTAPHWLGKAEYVYRLTDSTNGHATYATGGLSFRPLTSPYGAIQTAVIAGVNQGVFKAGPVILFAAAGAGVATGGSVSVGAFQAGGGVVIKLAKPIWIFDHIKIEAGVDKTAPTGVLSVFSVSLGHKL